MNLELTLAADPLVERPHHAEAAAPEVGAVVLVADDGVWSERMTTYLNGEGYRVVLDPTGSCAYDGRARSVDAAIVDLGSHPARAIETIVAWRRRTTAPLIAIAPGFDERSILDAYAAGADHVGNRGISSRQLLARLRSLLRRSQGSRTTTSVPVAAGDASDSVHLDDARSVAVVNGATVPLSTHELEFLGLLLERGGRVVTRAELSSRIDVSPENERTIDFFVRRLREKLERADGRRRIVAVRGVGFRFESRR